MSTDYKNLFETKRDYSNLFSNKEEIQPKIEQGPNMTYKNIFDNTSNGKETSQIKPVFPKRVVDPRVKCIQEIDPKISTHAVLNWIDSFEINMKNLTEVNQTISQKELDLALGFADDRLCVQTLFNDIKSIISKLKGPEKKSGFFAKLLNSEEDFILTQDIISNVIKSIKTVLEDFKNKAKFNNTMFLKSEMRKIDVDIQNLKSDLECAKVAAMYMIQVNDYKGAVRLEKVKQISGLVDVSELQLKNTYQLLEKDIEAYENLKDVTVPFLYVKIQGLLSNSLDTEALNVINDINKL